MSINIPDKFTKEEYNKLINKKLNTSDLGRYKNDIKENYKRPKGGTEYFLNESLSEEVQERLDYIFKRIGDKQFDSLKNVAKYLRMLLDEKNYIMLFAYNGTGKTRLSMEFKKLGQFIDEKTGQKSIDTLYYNAFTEDLFYWHNDLTYDRDRYLNFNGNSKFFDGLKELAIENRIRPFLNTYADFDFKIDYDKCRIYFYRDVMISEDNQEIDSIKISRGEENTFIWCFFLAIIQMIADGVEAYNWVKYIYIDDPISSLDDNNVIAVASNLAKLLSNQNIKIVISTHHTLFYNVLCNEINKPEQLYFQRKAKSENYLLKDTSKTPFFYHIALLKELKEVSENGILYTYHFNILRNILEKTASFHGYRHFSSCLRKGNDDNSIVYTRIINLLSHGNYSVFEPKEMVEENKEYFRTILNDFLDDYKFNRNIFKTEQMQEENE